MLEDGLNEAAGYSNPPEASTSNEKIIPEVISVNDYGFPLSLFVKVRGILYINNVIVIG